MREADADSCENEARRHRGQIVASLFGVQSRAHEQVRLVDEHRQATMRAD